MLLVGITPACAGKTPFFCRFCLCVQDHPRVCGKNAGRYPSITDNKGSPPRVREKPLVISLRRYTVGITPACAGKTLERESSRLSWEDHPRVCGKNYNYSRFQSRRPGSPPRVREKPGVFARDPDALGITPACAGKTRFRLCRCFQRRDHPRVCGKNSLPIC